ncbi:hypothetical protein HDV03_004894 [Kappamyces sp. JEL0829]|nr:hypothetical protein HDV03_004894 [Kappamyces sp. JEL0829]
MSSDCQIVASAFSKLANFNQLRSTLNLGQAQLTLAPNACCTGAAAYIRYRRETNSHGSCTAGRNIQSLNLLGLTLGAGPVDWALLGSLSQLTTLGLAQTGLSAQSLPDSALAPLTKLEVLNLSGNALSGNIPNLSSLAALQTLDLGSNQFSGSLPDNLSPGITSLSVANNQLTGGVPNSYGQLSKLDSFNIQGNPGISGPWPAPSTMPLKASCLLTSGICQLAGHSVPDKCTGFSASQCSGTVAAASPTFTVIPAPPSPDTTPTQPISTLVLACIIVGGLLLFSLSLYFCAWYWTKKKEEEQTLVYKQNHYAAKRIAIPKIATLENERPPASPMAQSTRSSSLAAFSPPHIEVYSDGNVSQDVGAAAEPSPQSPVSSASSFAYETANNTFENQLNQLAALSEEYLVGDGYIKEASTVVGPSAATAPVTQLQLAHQSEPYQVHQIDLSLDGSNTAASHSQLWHDFQNRYETRTPLGSDSNMGSRLDTSYSSENCSQNLSRIASQPIDPKDHTLLRSDAHEDTQSTSTAHHSAAKSSEGSSTHLAFYALMSHRPSTPGELELEKAQVVYLISVDPSGWGYGGVQTGKLGWFPLRCLDNGYGYCLSMDEVSHLVSRHA